MPKLPFITEVPEFKPRPHLGQDEALSKFQKDVLDALDVIEQKGDYSLDRAVQAWNGVLIIGGILILALVANLPIGALAVASLKHWLSP